MVYGTKQIREQGFNHSYVSWCSPRVFNTEPIGHILKQDQEDTYVTYENCDTFSLLNIEDCEGKHTCITLIFKLVGRGLIFSVVLIDLNR